jgi:hypothetical protein
LAGIVRVVWHGGRAARGQHSRHAEDSRSKQYAAPGGALMLLGLVSHRSSFARGCRIAVRTHFYGNRDMATLIIVNPVMTR